MKPLHFGARSPKPGDKLLIQKGSPVIATVTPKGPRLNLQPVQDRITITDPDAGDTGDLGKIGAIHLPGVTQRTDFNPYAKVIVIAVGPDVKTVKVGDELIVVRPQCTKLAFDGQIYFWTTEAAVMGIVKA